MSIIESQFTQAQQDLRTEIDKGRDIDYQRTLKCVLVLAIALSIAAAIYFFMDSRMYGAIVVGVAVVGLSFYHTPFAMMFLFFFFPLEGAFQMAQIGAGSRMVGLLIIVSYFITRFRWKILFPPSLIPMILFNLYAILSIIWAVSPSVSIEGNKALTLNIIMIFVLVNTVKDVKQMKMLIWAMFVGGIVSSVMIAQGQASFASGGEKMGRVVLGEGTSPNVLGNSILLCFLGGFYLFNEKGRLNKLVFILFGPLMLYAILNTQNRTALGTAILAPIAAFLFSARGKNLFKNILGIIAIAFVGYGLVYVALNTGLLSDMAKERMKTSDNDLSESGRVDQWKSGFEFLAQRPINGWGWKNFPEKFPVHRGIRSAHNNIVAIAGELGMIGITLWLIIYLVLFREAIKVNNLSLRWMSIAYIVFTLITGMTSTTIVRKEYWYALGFTLLAGTISTEQDNDTKRVSDAGIKTI